jgi:hypothetical protein
MPRTTMFIGYTGITPSIRMRLPGVGSHLIASIDVTQDYFDGAKTCKVKLAPGIPRIASGRSSYI